MLREFPSNLQTILPASKMRHTLDLHLSDGTNLYLSRGKVDRTIDGENENYSNWIKTVSGFNYSIDAPIDRVTVTCQNIDSTLGLYLASDLRKLDYAFAKYSRQYQSIRDASLIEDDLDQFRCVLANAEANEQEISFELIMDLEAIGDVLTSRTLSPRCPWCYKNGIECTATGSQPSCPKTRDACRERHPLEADEDKDAEFGGWEFFQDLIPSPPGSGGNQIGTRDTCFPAGTLVWTPKGFVPIEKIKVGDFVYSWNKITKQIDVQKVYQKFDHPNTTELFDFDFDCVKFSPTPAHKISTENGMIPADNFDLKKTKLSVYDTSCINSTDYKKGWQFVPMKSLKNNSDLTFTSHNFAVEEFATYFVKTDQNSNYVAAVSNSKDPGDLE